MSQKLNVLILEDSEDDADLLIRQLKQAGYEPAWERVETKESLTAALNRSDWDLLVSDHSMPRLSPLEALDFLKERGLDVPVIIVSGTIEEENAVAAMRAGASDYIMKGNTARLLPAIERELREATARRAARQVEQQLRQAQKMEAVGRLAGGVAHDFNNILTVIIGRCDLLLHGLDAKDGRREDLEDILAAGERAAALTRQLLAFSRKQMFVLRALDLNAVVANMERMLRRLIGEDVELVTAAGKDLGSIRADHGQVEQVIMNLAVNARDAMPRGGKVKIETANVDLDAASSGGAFEIKPGPYVMLSVSDTGSGMSREVLSHLFEPFFTTKELGKGTGLGLSTVYGIVKQSSAYIWVDSELGRGTTFRICFPRVQEAAQPLSSGGKSAGSLRGSETILLAEDDERLRNLLREMLVQNGYTVLAAAGGMEALRVCRENEGEIHLLVTDVVMPQMSGEDLARRLLEMRPRTKVLYLSGYTDKFVAPDGLRNPAMQFLQKPFSPESLARKVREVLEDGAQKGAGPA
jgi:two-component system cell cycle sensor histidine kinase/response regulator CckA